jgi:pimeloyl-ACP methyl ester carboxylesterase
MTRRFAVVIALLLPSVAAAAPDSLEFRDASRAVKPDSTFLQDARTPADSFFFSDPGPPPGSRALNSVRYMAPADAPYRAEEVRVRTAEFVFLGGTFTVPRLTPVRVGRRSVVPRSPAVILISGAGADDRDHSATDGVSRPFHDLADTLSRRGMGVLRLDDRGIGASSGRLDTATTIDRANDTRAAIAYLRRRADVDPKRIALLGFGEGAVIASIVAGEDSLVTGVVLIACPALSGKSLALARVRDWVDQRKSYGHAERDSAVADIMSDWQARLDTDPWTRAYLAYDPIPAVRRVRHPVLVIQDRSDAVVPPAHADSLVRVLNASGNRQVTLRAYPDLGPSLLHGVPKLPGEIEVSARPVAATNGDPTPPKPMAREVLGVIANWLAARLRVP